MKSIYGLVFLGLLACSNPPESSQGLDKPLDPPKRKVIVLDERLNEILDPNSEIEILAEGFDWSEGPLWLSTEEKLIFSDVPRNIIYEWSEKSGKKVYLKPSGYTSQIERGGEMGSNGLLLDPEGQLVICQHGDRRMARMDAPLSKPRPVFISMADRFQAKKFNSPNDAAFDQDGYLFFTDPPYGLEGNVNDPSKELSWQGIYRVTPKGVTDLIIPTLSRPNGIAFAPDNSKVYVANSDSKQAIWMVYEFNKSKQFENGKIFYDATPDMGNGPGAPDGLKVNDAGIIFATGPGGVHVFHPDGTLFGKISTGQATSNCAFGPDQKSLYMTADFYVMRIKLK